MILYREHPKTAFIEEPSFQTTFLAALGDICIYRKRQSPARDSQRGDYWLT